MNKRKVRNWNMLLEVRGFALRTKPNATHSYMELSTGVVIPDKRSTRQFINRFKNGYNMDLAYSADELISRKYIEHKLHEGHQKGGKACIEKHGKKMIQTMLANGPWNKGKGGYKMTPCSEEKKRKIGDKNAGSGNGMYGVKMSDEAKKHKSEIMKQKILNGEFTPNSNNRFTHFDIEYNGKKFRSSWEAAWQMLNPMHEYETQRLSYLIDEKERVYIVDFFDVSTNTLIEIKPKELTYSKSFKAKKESAEKWAHENNGRYLVISQEYFIEHLDRIMVSDLPDEVKIKLKGMKTR